MTGISLYGVVTEILRENNTSEVVFSLKIEDKTGATCAKLRFAESWYKKEYIVNLYYKTITHLLPLQIIEFYFLCLKFFIS